MSEGQDPDIFINEANHLRDEMMYMGEVSNDDRISDVVLEGLTDDYVQIKYSAEAENDFSLEQAVITMRNMYAKRVMRNGPWRKAKGLESVMVTTSTPSAAVICSNWKKTGQRFQRCFARKKKMNGKKTSPDATKELMV